MAASAAMTGGGGKSILWKQYASARLLFFNRSPDQMGIVYFHDLPVYRLSEKAYYKRRDEEISAFVADAFSGLSFSPQQEQNLTLRMEQHYHDKVSGSLLTR
jgi:hypothetical protein